MNREQAITNLGFGRAFAALAPPAEDRTLQVDLDTLVAVLEALPGYAEIDVQFVDDDGGDRIFHLMARDIPGPSRRFTNLTHGTEWLDIRSCLTNAARYVYVRRHDDPGQAIWVTL